MYDKYFQKTRSAIRSLWNDRATITGDIPYITDYGVTKFKKDEIIIEDEPCRVSFSMLQSAKDNEQIDTTQQVIKLFIDNELDIPAGSKIKIIRNGKTLHFKNVGLPAYYTNHQEIILETAETYV